MWQSIATVRSDYRNLPSVFDKRVSEAVARDVEEAAYQRGVARRDRILIEGTN